MMRIIFVAKRHQELLTARGRHELGARGAVILEQRIDLGRGIPALERYIVKEAEGTAAFLRKPLEKAPAHQELTRRRECREPSGEVHGIAENIIVSLDDLAEMAAGIGILRFLCHRDF